MDILDDLTLVGKMTVNGDITGTKTMNVPNVVATNSLKTTEILSHSVSLANGFSMVATGETFFDPTLTSGSVQHYGDVDFCYGKVNSYSSTQFNFASTPISYKTSADDEYKLVDNSGIFTLLHNNSAIVQFIDDGCNVKFNSRKVYFSAQTVFDKFSIYIDYGTGKLTIANDSSPVVEISNKTSEFVVKTKSYFCQNSVFCSRSYFCGDAYFYGNTIGLKPTSIWISPKIPKDCTTFAMETSGSGKLPMVQLFDTQTKQFVEATIGVDFDTTNFTYSKVTFTISHSDEIPAGRFMVSYVK